MEFIIIFIYAMLFILTFKVQQIFLTNKYFAFSDHFVVNQSVTLEKYIYRIIIIAWLTVFSYLILNIFYEPQEIFNLLLVGNFLGSFLTVWPVIFQPKKNLEVGLSKKTIFILYFIYLFFIVSTVLISVIVWNILYVFFADDNIVTLLISNKESIIFEIIILLPLLIVEHIFSKKYSKRSEKESIENQVETNQDSSDDFVGFEEGEEYSTGEDLEYPIENDKENQEYAVEDVETDTRKLTVMNLISYQLFFLTGVLILDLIRKIIRRV